METARVAHFAPARVPASAGQVGVMVRAIPGWACRLAPFLRAALCVLCCIVALPRATAAMAPGQNRAPDVAFYYQRDVPVDLLKAFDIVVLDPRVSRLAIDTHAPHDIWYARLGPDDLEQMASSADGWFGSRLPALKQAGYSGFMLDDGLDLDREDAAADARLEQVLQAFAARAPAIPLLLRNHPQLAVRHAARLRALVVDGLYQRGPVRSGMLARTPDGLRTRVLGQVRQAQADTGLTVVGLDYCPATGLDCRRELAGRLQADGLVPYVSDPALSVVGVGALEVLPRTVLMIIDRRPSEALDSTEGARLYTMPLNQLGYAVEYANVDRLPAGITRDRYAGIVTALDRSPANSVAWRDWLLRRMGEGMPVAILGSFGFELAGARAAALGLQQMPIVRSPGVLPRIVHQDALVGFEALPDIDAQSLSNFRVAASGRALLTVEAAGRRHDMVGLMPWGGFALPGCTVTSVGSLGSERWVLQPIEFLRQALRLPPMPTPVFTTENGLRLLFVHIDGDGFASHAELPGTPFAARPLMDRILKRYPIPHTISIIEGEVGRDGMYPEDSPRLERLAKAVLALPQVELGSHTFSHPFFWQSVENRRLGLPDTDPEEAGDEFNLPIPGYAFNLDREIAGTIRYIDTRLAPAGKRVEILQWSGDAIPSAHALRKAYEAGVLNINGGDTVITRSRPSWTGIAAVGLAKGPGDADFQVHAGIMNENVFTDDWNGPYYGFRQVRETFDLTDSPIRFKPLNIYYHFYSATKEASLAALRQVYDAALAGPVLPIYTSEYARKVLDWLHVAVARRGDEWVVRAGAELRELRWSGAGVPQLATAAGVSGYDRGPDGTYIHMGGDLARFRIGPAAAGDIPYVSEAAGRISGFERQGRDMRFQFGGYYKPYVTLKDAAGCKVRIDGRPAAARSTYRVSGGPAKPMQEHLVEVLCE